MNNVTRYRPLNSVFAMPRDLGRLMDDVFGGSWEGGENLRQWLPATDVSETPEAVTLRLEVPALLAAIARVEIRHGRHAATLTPLRHLFDRFSRGLLIHVRSEDAVLFPAIVAIEAAFAHQRTRPWTEIARPIELLEADHAGAAESLSHMRLLTRGWALPDDAGAEFRALYQDLARLERDLHVHLHLENQVLFPRATALARMVGAMSA